MRTRTRVSGILLGIVLLLSAASCAYDGGRDGGAPAPPSSDGSDNTDDTAPGGDGEGRDPNVVEYEDLGAEWACRRPETCIWDYLEFFKKAALYSDPVSEADLLGRIADVENGLVSPLTDRLPEKELRERLTEILNIRFLVDGIDRRPLTVVTIAESGTLAYKRTDLLFIDPYIGTFEGILLVPRGSGPHPAVVAIHGHRDDAEIYLRRFHGREYPSHGLAILMLTMRGMGIDLFEHDASKRLLLDGFTLIGLRVYETLLGFKYLRYRADIDGARIGLIGHSGGSGASNLTVRVEPRFAAYVSDLAIDYCEWGTILEPWHCETVPELYPYHPLINDFSTSTVSVLAVPYGYTNGMEEIFRFFNEYLGE